MDKIIKPVIFVAPLTLSLKTLRDTLTASAETENIEVFNIENVDELNQTLASIGPSLTLISSTEKCNQLLKKNKKYIAQFKSKVLLVTQASVSAIDIDKMNKMGLSENMYEPINQKTLLYKAKMLIKALPVMKTKEEEEEQVQTFSSDKEEQSVKTNEKLHLEKGVISEDGLELDSDNMEEEKTLFSLEEFRKKKKNQSNLEIESENEDKTSNELELKKDEKKSRLGSLLKSLGSFGKKKTDDKSLDLEASDSSKESTNLNLDANDEQEVADGLRLEKATKKQLEEGSTLDIERSKKKLSSTKQELGEYNKKELSASLSLDQGLDKKDKRRLELAPAQTSENDLFNLTLDDIEKMRKQGIPIHIPANTSKEKLDLLLSKDPILRKRVLDFKLAEAAKKKKASIKMVDEVKAKKRDSVVKFDLGFTKKEKKSDAESIREKILEEKRRLLEKKLEEERILKAIEEESTLKAKEIEPEIIYEPNSKSMEKIIDLLTVYQDKKMDRLEILKRASQTVFELKHGLTAFLAYLEDKKEYEDIFIAHNQDFNTDKEARGEEFWKTQKHEKIKTWSTVKLSSWSDEWFTGNAREAEFIYPVIEGKSYLGLIVVHIKLRDNEQLTEADSKKIEVFIESTRGVYLERFKGNKDKGAGKEDNLAGDGTSYSKIFKDFFEKIFKKAG